MRRMIRWLTLLPIAGPMLLNTWLIIIYHCKANTPLGLPGTFIAGEIRRNIFLSVKECLHNIVKHADASSVSFSVELGNMIKITIHDNGKGIDWNNKRAFSNGIQNIQQRMKEIKGEVKFLNEQGTKVVLTIPL